MVQHYAVNAHKHFINQKKIETKMSKKKHERDKDRKSGKW